MGVFPDMVAYHEYGDPSGALGYVEDLRNYLSCARSGPTHFWSMKYWGRSPGPSPGYTAAVIAAYERANILSAMRPLA